MKLIHMAAFLVAAVGGLNWGIIGIFKYNPIYAFFGSMPVVERGIYVAVGLATLFLIVTHKMTCATCSGKDN